MCAIEGVGTEKVDQKQFSEYVDLSYRKVYQTAYRLTGNRPDAEDLTQEAFVRAYRKFNDFQGDRPFENWILRIVSRLFLDLLRSRKRRIQASSIDAALMCDSGDLVTPQFAMDGCTPESCLMENVLDEDLEIVMSSLSPSQRLLVVMADVEQMPYAEIAVLMEKPLGTIRSRLHRIHRLMRDRLEQTQRANGSPSNKILRPVLG